MSKPPECAATFFKNFRSILVGHLGLQSVTYRVDTPCNMNFIPIALKIVLVEFVLVETVLVGDPTVEENAQPRKMARRQTELENCLNRLWNETSCKFLSSTLWSEFNYFIQKLWDFFPSKTV